MADKKLAKAKNNESGVITQQLSAVEVTTAYVDPVPAYAPGIIVLEPESAKEEHIFFRKRDAGAGTISGLIRDITNLNSGVGFLHTNGEDWETMQASEYINNIIDVLQEGWQMESQVVAYASATTFTVQGNQTGFYTAGRFVRYDESNSKIGIVDSSSYDSGSGLTTVTVRGFSVPNPLTSIELANFQPKGFSSVMPIFFGEDAGANDTYAVTILPNIGAYFRGLTVIFKAATANTGAATLNINGLGAVTIKMYKGNDLATGAIEAGQYVLCVHDGTNFQLLSANGQLISDTAIYDTNGNEVIKTPATASAVNEITATNAATGNKPTVSATGDDTDIGMLVKGKGSKGVEIKKIVPTAFTLTDAATVAVDAALGTLAILTMAGDRTIANPTNLVEDGQLLVFRLIQDATGTRVPSWDTKYKFGASGAPTLSTAANKIDYVAFRYNATADQLHYMGSQLTF